MIVPKKARFNCITENDGYKLVPANKVAETFCEKYGTSKLRMSEASSLRIASEQINWNA